MKRVKQPFEKLQRSLEVQRNILILYGFVILAVILLLGGIYYTQNSWAGGFLGMTGPGPGSGGGGIEYCKSDGCCTGTSCSSGKCACTSCDAVFKYDTKFDYPVFSMDPIVPVPQGTKIPCITTDSKTGRQTYYFESDQVQIAEAPPGGPNPDGGPRILPSIVGAAAAWALGSVLLPSQPPLCSEEVTITYPNGSTGTGRIVPQGTYCIKGKADDRGVKDFCNAAFTAPPGYEIVQVSGKGKCAVAEDWNEDWDVWQGNLGTCVRCIVKATCKPSNNTGNCTQSSECSDIGEYEQPPQTYPAVGSGMIEGPKFCTKKYPDYNPYLISGYYSQLPQVTVHYDYYHNAAGMLQHLRGDVTWQSHCIKNAKISNYCEVCTKCPPANCPNEFPNSDVATCLASKEACDTLADKDHLNLISHSFMAMRKCDARAIFKDAACCIGMKQKQMNPYPPTTCPVGYEYVNGQCVPILPPSLPVNP